MWKAYSLKQRKMVTAEECSYSDTSKLQIKCPYCYQPVLLRKGDYVSPYFAHYSTNKTYSAVGLNNEDCPNRVNGEGSYGYSLDFFVRDQGQHLITQFANFSQFFDDFIRYKKSNAAIYGYILDTMKAAIKESASNNVYAKEILLPQMAEFYKTTLVHFLQQKNATLLRCGSFLKSKTKTMIEWLPEAYLSILKALAIFYKARKFDFHLAGQAYAPFLNFTKEDFTPSFLLENVYKKLREKYSSTEALLILGLYYNPATEIKASDLLAVVYSALQLLKLYKADDLFDINKCLTLLDNKIRIHYVKENLMMIKVTKEIPQVKNIEELEPAEQQFIERALRIPVGRNLPLVDLEPLTVEELNAMGDCNLYSVQRCLRESGKSVKIIGNYTINWEHW